MDGPNGAIRHPTLGTLDEFLRYLEKRHSTTRHMLVPYSDVVQFVFLADGNIDAFEGSIRHCYYNHCRYESLANYSWEERIKRVRERIDAGEIPEDWIDKLKASMS